ncbi:MAG: hypothetical protein EZS28_001783 [Streblomastix strix]|uniref:PARG catalytic Macro domain-containing protein n=1 Tax=Streblomastix strix TaxID=222440 RepID=A0A5J4X720_9EUKA|nr:MAG: hypothetical protein EZS28_001783 [Streblomastix strix]
MNQIYLNQWDLQSVLRELNKSFVGFSFAQPLNEQNEEKTKQEIKLQSEQQQKQIDIVEQEQDQYKQINIDKKERDASNQIKGGVLATGHWGCGAFKGDQFLKFIIQWIAASEAGVTEMRYSCMMERNFIQMVTLILNILQPEYSVINQDDDFEKHFMSNRHHEHNKDQRKILTAGSLYNHLSRYCEIMQKLGKANGDGLFAYLLGCYSSVE